MSARSITGASDYLARWLCPAAASSDVLRVRSVATRQLDSALMPNRRAEAWRYTSLRTLLAADLAAVPQAPVFATGAPDPTSCSWDICDGFCNHSLVNKNYPPGIEVGGLDLLSKDPTELDHLLATRSTGWPFDVLNLAALTDALVISVDEDTDCTTPLHIRYASSMANVAQHALVVLHLKQGATCTLIEEDSDRLRGYLNVRLLIRQDANSVLRHQRLQYKDAGWQTCNLDVRLSSGAQYELVQASLGSELRRNDLTVTLAGMGAQAVLQGACFSTGKQQLDNHLTLIHAEPGGQSNVSFRSLAAGASKGIFNGRILIEQGADKTVANLQSRNILLSDTAEIDTKPELEIYASDVQCAHGATVGYLDQDAIFYLGSRGIHEHQAKRLLAMGFAAEVMDAVWSEQARALWLRHVSEGMELSDAGNG